MLHLTGEFGSGLIQQFRYIFNTPKTRNPGSSELPRVVRLTQCRRHSRRQEMKSSVGILLLVFSSTILVAQERLPIIDMHLHAIPAESVRDEVAIPGLTRPPTEEAIMRETLNALERNNVVKALVSGPVEMIYKWKAAAPDRLIASPYIMYDQPWPKLVDLRAAYSHRKLGALGEIGAQYIGLTLSSPEFEPYLALASRRH